VSLRAVRKRGGPSFHFMQPRVVADIIGMTESIALQTNMLALNDTTGWEDSRLTRVTSFLGTVALVQSRSAEGATHVCVLHTRRLCFP
jgi:hypothetical protein